MKNKGVDLTGRIFSRLTVLSEQPKDKNSMRRWLCSCECGNEKVIYQNALCSGVTRSCGCYNAEQTSKRMSQGWNKVFTQEYLLKEHKEKQRSLREIAKEHGCNVSCIIRYMRKFEIEANDPFYALAGQKIEMLFVKDLSCIKNGRSYWNCVCDCGKEKVVCGHSIVRRSAISCGCWNKKKNWQGVGDLGKNYWSRIVKHASERNLDFSISMEYAWNLFQKQKGKCALSGVDMLLDPSWGKNTKMGQSKHTASLDRIDSSKGYIEGNVQWVHKAVNKMKSNLLESDFIFWCTKISKYRD
jgi:hypothetical protein